MPRPPTGALLRPHIVFFGEAVPQFDHAVRIAAAADVLIVVGTSLAVYPAASLVHYVRPGVPIYLVDPGAPDVRTIRNPADASARAGGRRDARTGRTVCAGRSQPE